MDSTDSATHGGSGTAGDPFHMASLRGAVIRIDTTHTAADTITLPAGTYTLSIPGGGEASSPGNPAVGDLDVRFTGLTIQGAGPASTIIQQTSGTDRVVDVNPMYNVGNFFFTITGVTITGGRAAGDAGGLFRGSNDTGLPGHGLITVTNCVFKNNSTTGPGFGGGAIQHFGGDLAVSNCVFGGTGGSDPNISSTSGGAIAAIGYQAAATFAISNCTFSNNVANSGSSGGGALDLVNVNLGTATASVTNCTFTGNNAPTARGGAIINESAPTTISECNFVNNHAGNSGGVLYGSSTATIQFSRFVGNSCSTPANGNVMGQSTNSGSIIADTNWWGHNNGPATNDKGAGAITVTKWLQLKLSASPTTIMVGQNSTLTASFLSDSANNVIAASNLDALIGQSVSWTSGPLGTLSGQQLTIQAAGTATATFTGTGGGNATPSAQVDGAPAATASITVIANHPPSGADKTVSTTEDTFYTFTAADFGFTDPNDTPPHAFLAVKVTTLPALGALTLTMAP